jgi:hypothetical protein
MCGTLRGTDLLERTSSLAALGRYAAEARGGAGRMVLLAGEAGVGRWTPPILVPARCYCLTPSPAARSNSVAASPGAGRHSGADTTPGSTISKPLGKKPAMSSMVRTQ